MQFLVIFRRFVAAADAGMGFKGDNRTANSALDATARTVGAVVIGPNLVGDPSGSSSGSSHDWLILNKAAERFGRTHSKVSASITVGTRTVDTISFYCHTAGAVPYIPKSPDNDTFLKMTTKFSKTMVAFEGELSGDKFTDAEVIVVDGAWNTGLLLHYVSDEHNAATLMGAGEADKLGSFSLRMPIDKDGLFLMSAAPAVSRLTA